MQEMTGIPLNDFDLHKPCPPCPTPPAITMGVHSTLVDRVLIQVGVTCVLCPEELCLSPGSDYEKTGTRHAKSV